MTYNRTFMIEGSAYGITLSDEKETLLAAAAAGRVIVGLDSRMPSRYIYLPVAGELPDDAYLERIIRREKGLPWHIAESDELLIRELCLSDLSQIPSEPEDTEDDRIFQNPQTLKAYIREQYGYFEYGMWAVIRKKDSKLIGIAGVNADLMNADVMDVGTAPSCFELGYHIYQPYRRHGYAVQACRMILSYLYEEFGEQTILTARVRPDNLASIRVLRHLGFVPKQEAFSLTDLPDFWVLLPPSS